MKIEVTREEMEDLREAIRVCLKGLTHELNHTDQRAYKVFLKEKLARFERLAADVEASARPTGELPQVSP